MANIIMQYTKKYSDIDVFVYDDDTVRNVSDLSPRPSAIVVHNEDNSISVDLVGRGIQDINPWPILATVRVKREIGWQGNLGWRVHILEWDESIDPGVYALAVYSDPEGVNYQFTTGAFVFDEEVGLWGAVCPPGFEPGRADVHFGMLYASINYSNFTLYYHQNEFDFETGGS